MPGDTVRPSPYEKGLYFVGGTVGTAQWQVGSRYSLEKVLGHGGFSSVCLAVDHQTGEKVALKRIPDVLSSPEQAKRVLREVSILRRLRHQNIIGLKDCFIRPSATGQCRLIQGKLVNLSIDVYISMEYAEGGDLFHLKGQVSAEQVKSVMWQLTQCIKYLHDLHIWHRDLKSQNVFISWENGELVAKLGDFGSARSAIPEGYEFVEQHPPSKSTAFTTLQPRPRMCPSDSYDEMHKTTERGDIYVRVENAAKTGRTGFKAPLTRVVATPCYRAPEVVMSRGGYTAAIDIWGLGCILGELLQRVAHVGSAATPNLQIAPLFAIHDLPNTPQDGEKFAEGPGNQTTRIELQALFDVIGTPAWADAAGVEHPAWRAYLHRLPGKAATLYRRFAPAGEVAVDLLRRMLAFDPPRRCGAEEALAHEFFAELMSEDSGLMEEGSWATLGAHGAHHRSSRLLHTGSERNMEGVHSLRSSREDMAGQGTPAGHSAGALVGSLPPQPLVPPGKPPLPPHAHKPPPCQAALPHAGPATLQQHDPAAAGACLGDEGQGGDGGAASGSHAVVGAQPTAAAAQGGDADVAMLEVSPFEQGVEITNQAGGREGAEGQQAGGTASTRMSHYWEEPDLARALGMLEDEMASITAGDTEPGGPGCQKLRSMLELECQAIAASHGGSFGRGVLRRKKKGGQQEHGVLGGLLQKAGPGLQLDTASDSQYDPADYGQGRLNNVADTWAGKELDPEKYLGPQRHGEWTAFSGAGPPPGPRWGVTAMPPGSDAAQMDPRMAAIIKAQQLR